MTKRQALIRVLGHAANLIRDAADNGHESLSATDGVGAPYLSDRDWKRVCEAVGEVETALNRRMFRLQEAEARVRRETKR